MKSLKALAGGAFAVLLGALSFAQIERLSLEQMVQRTDDAVHGTITAKHTFRVDHPVDGPAHYFTTLTVEGRSLVTGAPATTDVTFIGGSDGIGSWTSEAPSDHETAIGREVVAFYTWSDNMGADVAANALYAAHGGLYTTFRTGGVTIVQGRGPGYAVETNVQVESLQSEISALAGNK